MNIDYDEVLIDEPDEPGEPPADADTLDAAPAVSAIRRFRVQHPETPAMDIEADSQAAAITEYRRLNGIISTIWPTDCFEIDAE